MAQTVTKDLDVWGKKRVCAGSVVQTASETSIDIETGMEKVEAFTTAPAVTSFTKSGGTVSVTTSAGLEFDFIAVGS